MTPQELRAWITGRALTIKAAAEMLGLSEDGLAHQLNGRRPVSEQTRQLCQLWDAYDDHGILLFPKGYKQSPDKPRNRDENTR